MGNKMIKEKYLPAAGESSSTCGIDLPDNAGSVITFRKPNLNKHIRSGRTDMIRNSATKILGSSIPSILGSEPFSTEDGEVLTKEQAAAMRALESGDNIFLTGEAGTGKSYVLNEYLKRNSDKNILVCAFTGIAAINVNGSTIHRVFKAPVGILEPGEYNPNPPEAVVKADIIVIDEISMLRIDLFEYVMLTVKYAEELQQEHEDCKAKLEGRKPKKISNKKLIVVGDFYQLPPVIGQREENVFYGMWKDSCGGFAFASELWKKAKFITVMLKQVVRQSGDPEFIKNLNMIRVGDARGIAWFNYKISYTPQENAIFLCGANKMAEEINERESNALPGEPKSYYARSTGTVNEGDKATADVLSLKVGMQVMTLVNSPDGDYQNGSLGQIVSLHDDHVVVKLNSGRVVVVNRFEWEVAGYEVHKDAVERVVIGRFNQLPLKVAYAVTIHKSQGQTYDKVNVYPQCFAPGQLYVALSRARNSAGMSLAYPIQPGAVMTNPHVKRFYEEI